MNEACFDRQHRYVMPCYHPLDPSKFRSFKLVDQKRPINLRLPCGQCVGCRLERSRQWAVRCMHEASLYEDNSFLTLTYHDSYLPSHGSLVLRDFQLFMKRLRKSVAPKRVRFYHCGEYGETFNRPHYHALLFNHDFADKKFFSKRGDHSVYTSATLASHWDKGFSVIGQVTFDSAAYVARYIMKKVTGPNSEAHYGGRKPEYTTMSRRPGIGSAWYDRFKSDVYPLDRVVVNGKETRPPRYYDRLFEKDDRSTFEQIKIARAKDSLHYVDDFYSDGSSLKIDDASPVRLAVKEVVKKAEITLRLPRPLEGVI